MLVPRHFTPHQICIFVNVRKNSSIIHSCRKYRRMSPRSNEIFFGHDGNTKYKNKRTQIIRIAFAFEIQNPTII